MAVLRCEGLFEARVSLQQRPYPPQWAAAKRRADEAVAAAAAAGEAAAGGAGAQQQPPSEAAAAAQSQQQQQQPGEAGDAAAAVAPVLRWQWLLADAVILPGAAHRASLREPQLRQLLHLLRTLMGATADAAAVEAETRRGAPAGGGAAAGKPGGGASSGAAPSLPSASARSSGGAAAALSMDVSGISGLGGGAASMLLGGLGDGGGDASHGLGLEELRADEVAAPLRAMHGVLRDVAAQALLDLVRSTAEGLAAPGGRWHGHLALSRAQVLSPGVRLHYWANTPVALPGAAGVRGGGGGGAAATSAATGGAGPDGGRSSGRDAAADASALPALEIGVAGDGTVQVLHLPPLRVPGTGAALPLQLDAHSADVEALLLRAACLTGNAQLQLLQLRLSALLAAHGMAHVCVLRLRPAAGAGGGAMGGSAADVAFSRHELEVLVEGASLLRVLYQPWSGWLLLRPGDAAGGDDNLDAVMQEEGLHQLQSAGQQQQQHQPDQRAAAEQLLAEAARQLAVTVAEMWHRARVARLRAAARGLSLRLQQYDLRYAGGGPLIPQPPPPPPTTPGSAGAQQQQQRRHHQHTRRYIHLAFPSTPLPPYLRAPAGAGPAPGGAAALGFLLSVQFPPVDDRRFWLLAHARDAQGLPGPVFARLPVPASALAGALTPQPPQPAAVAAPARQGSGQLAGAGGRAPEGLGKRKRSGDEAGEGAAGDGVGEPAAAGAGGEPAAPAAVVAPPLPAPGWQQDSAIIRELSAAAAWARRRITHERLLFELRALGVACQELQPQGLSSSAAATSPVSAAAPPAGALQLRLVGPVGGEELGVEFARKAGAAVGVHEAVLCARGGASGAEDGAWSMHLRGRLFRGFGAKGGGSESGGGGESSGGGWLRFDYSFDRGEHARDALLHLLRVLRMQRLLARLEALALGPQCLEVDDVTDGGAMTQSDENGAGGEDGGSGRPAKKARRGPLANGAAAGGEGGEGGAPGLVWHWAGSGTVRLVGCSSTAAVIECGRPQPAPPSVAGGATQQGTDGEGAEPRLRLALSWAPLLTEPAAAAATIPSAPAAPHAALQLRCRVRSGAPAVDAALQSLGEMADAEEPGLLLDALGLCGAALAGLGAALRPEALRRAGVGARDVSAHGRGSPYSARLLVAGKSAGKAAAAARAVDLAFASGGRVRLSLERPRPAAGAAPPRSSKQQQAAALGSSVLHPPEPDAELPKALAAALPGVKLVPDGGGAVWVHVSNLVQAVGATLAVAQSGLGGKPAAA